MTLINYLEFGAMVSDHAEKCQTTIVKHINSV